jgi:hypothetical protein
VNEGQRSFFLNTTDETWGEQIPEAQIAVTEWNTAGNTGSLDRNSDYGLYQSHEMINIMEEFLRYDVENAHVWPLIQNTPNTLSVDDGQAELSPGGAIFNMMQEALPGKTALDLTPESGADTEVEEDGIALHGFWEPDELLFYVAATEEGGADTSVDFSNLVTETGRMEISVLGVAEGDTIGSNSSDALVETVDPELLVDGTTLSVQMDQGEIMQVRMFGFTPSEEFQNVISDEAPEDLPEPMIDPFTEESAVEAEEAPVEAEEAPVETERSPVEAEEADLPFPTVPATAITDETLAAEEAAAMDEADSDDDDGMADILAAIPFLGLLALFM